MHQSVTADIETWAPSAPNVRECLLLPKVVHAVDQPASALRNATLVDTLNRTIIITQRPSRAAWLLRHCAYRRTTCSRLCGSLVRQPPSQIKTNPSLCVVWLPTVNGCHHHLCTESMFVTHRNDVRRHLPDTNMFTPTVTCTATCFCRASSRPCC
jgi:hypothetical protein